MNQVVPQPCDVLVRGTVITMDRERTVLSDGFVAVQGSRIVGVGAAGECTYTSADTVGGPGHLVMPGLVNAHAQLVQGCLRGVGEGTARFRDRLFGFYYPMTAACDEERSYVAALSPLLELAVSGVTTTQDTHFANQHKRSIDGVLRAVRDVGLRCRMTRAILNDPETAAPAVHETVEEGLREVERVRDDWQSDSVRVATGPLGITYVALADVRPIWEWTVRNQTQFDLHAPTAMDAEYLAERGWRGGAVGWLADQGMLSGNTLLIGPDDVTHEEIDAMGRCQVKVSLNTDLLNGVLDCHVREYLESGVTVGLGVDGSAVASHQNPWYLIRNVVPAQRIADRLGHHPGEPIQPRFGSPELALELATIGGAKALGWDDRIGSLEMGKEADLLVLDLRDAPHLHPQGALLTNLVYAGPSNLPHISHVYVGGRAVVRERRPLIDVAASLEAADRLQRELAEATGCLPFLSRLGSWRSEGEAETLD